MAAVLDICSINILNLVLQCPPLKVRTWTDNFKATVGGIRWQLGKDEESYVFDKIQKHWKPSESERHCKLGVK